METVDGWPRHRQEAYAWRQVQRSGSKADRELREVVTNVPPRIADLAPTLDGSLVARLEEAVREIVTLDTHHSQDLHALGTLLIRTESVASSKIENVEASVDDYARALHGIRSNPSAVSMVAATRALSEVIDVVGDRHHIDLGMILRAHAVLMADDPSESSYAGRVRDVQNWIGGSDHSPRNALYVPPTPSLLDELLVDLMAFANREDLPVLAQAAIAHAQFESIHPFTDGNGRIGRALVNAVLRRRGTTSRVVLPLASALVARRDRYFDQLGAYRDGDPVPLINEFARASVIVAREARTTAVRLAEVTSSWSASLGAVRAGSVVARLLAALPAHPVLSADDAHRLVGGPVSSVYTALARLTEAGVTRPLTTRQRDQVWGAGLILDELEDLAARIADAS